MLRSLLGGEARNEPLESLLAELFPSAAWAFGGNNYANLEDRWYRDLRVGHPDVFDRYFQLDVPEGDISQAELDLVLAIAGDREQLSQLFRGFEGEGKLPALLDRLEAYKQVIPADHTLGFVTALFDIGDDLSDQSDEFIGIAPDMHAVRLIHWSLKSLPADWSAPDVLRQALSDTSGLFLPIRYVSIEVGKGSGAEGARDDRVLTETEAADLATACVAKIREAAASARLTSHRHLAYILYRWKEWGDGDEASAWARELLDEPDGVLILLGALVRPSRSIGMGEYVARVTWKLRLSEIEAFASLDDVRTRLANLADALDEDQTRAVDAFRQADDRRQRGLPEDDWASDDDEE